MLHQYVQRLVRNPVFAGILTMFADAKWEVIKEISYEGQVCLNHVGVDLTNWTYTAFYTLLLVYADEGHILHHYAEKWPSTVGNAAEVHTKSGAEKAGDVIEFLLGFWRRPGLMEHAAMAAISVDDHRLFIGDFEGGLKAVHRMLRFFSRDIPPCRVRDRLVHAFEFYDFPISM